MSSYPDDDTVQVESRTFIRSDGSRESIVSTPEMVAKVADIVAEQDQADRAHAMTLAAVRKAASLTQTELAHLLGVNQAAVSKLERSADNDRSLLLSTLRNYLTAAGATDIGITLTVAGQTMTIPLAELLGTPEPADEPAAPAKPPSQVRREFIAAAYAASRPASAETRRKAVEDLRGARGAAEGPAT